MKKIFIIFALCFLLSSFSGAFAYNDTDVSNAQFLASENLIVNQSSSADFRLDDTITRAEVVGIALKMKWVELPENYTCKNYFTDVKYDEKNNWICRAVELAADNGLITRENSKFRPSDNITRAESFAIIYEASGVAPIWLAWDFFPDDSDIAEWQKVLFIKIWDTHINISGAQYMAPRDGYYKVFPNRFATRSEIFDFSTRSYIHPFTDLGLYTGNISNKTYFTAEEIGAEGKNATYLFSMGDKNPEGSYGGRLRLINADKKVLTVGDWWSIIVFPKDSSYEINATFQHEPYKNYSDFRIVMSKDIDVSIVDMKKFLKFLWF